MEYSNDLFKLLGQHPEKLKIKYNPNSKLAESEVGLYYRVYANTTGQDVIEVPQPLSIPLYTREMKTAIMKRWLEINSQDPPLEPKFNIGVYLSKPEQYSTLFHLIELGDKNAERYYSLVNKKIIENTELFDWLHIEFKAYLFLYERRRYLSFKYLVDKLTGNFTKPDEGELTGLNYILLEQARNTIIYDEKKKLVEEFFEAFKKFTENPRHFDLVKDLDYFFLVFESLLSIETTEEEETEEETEEEEAEVRARPGEAGEARKGEEEAGARAAEEARARAAEEARARAAEEARARAAREAEAAAREGEAAAAGEARAAEGEAGAEEGEEPPQPKDIAESLTEVLRITLEEEIDTLTKEISESDDLIKELNEKKTILEKAAEEAEAGAEALEALEVLEAQSAEDEPAVKLASIEALIASSIQDKAESERSLESSTEMHSHVVINREKYIEAFRFSIDELESKYFTESLYSAYLLYKKMSELSIGDYKGNEHTALQKYLGESKKEDIIAEKETKKREFTRLGDDEKKQIIFAFVRASNGMETINLNTRPGIDTDDIIEKVKANIDSWKNFYESATEYIKIMLDVQVFLRRQTNSRFLGEAQKIMKKTKPIIVRQIFKDSKLLKGPYNRVYGVFVVDAQSETKCGLHAINNLLQIKNKDCLATAKTCKLSRVLRGDTAIGGNYLQSQQIVNIINGGDNGATRELHPEFLKSKYSAEFLPTNEFDVYDGLIGKKSGNKKFLGIIEKKIGHYVAWLLKNVNEGEYIWLEIDSVGEITPYSYEDGLTILKSRPKNLVGEQSLGAYEHIAVYEAENARASDGNGLDISKCFENDDINETNINDITPAPAPTSGAGRIRKNKSKRRYAGKKRTGKKSKKINY